MDSFNLTLSSVPLTSLDTTKELSSFEDSGTRFFVLGSLKQNKIIESS
jgi:hypothetical protein